MLNQEILQYLRENKDKFSRDVLMQELKRAGYAHEEIKEGVVEVYSGQKNFYPRSISIKNGVTIFIFLVIYGYMFGAFGLDFYGVLDSITIKGFIASNLYSSLFIDSVVILTFYIYPAIISSLLFIFVSRWTKRYVEADPSKFFWYSALGLHLVIFLLVAIAWFFYPIVYSNMFIDSDGLGFIYVWYSGIYYVPIIIGLFAIIPSIFFYKIFKAKDGKFLKIFNKVSSVLFWISIVLFVGLMTLLMVQFKPCNGDTIECFVEEKILSIEDSYYCEYFDGNSSFDRQKNECYIKVEEKFTNPNNIDVEISNTDHLSLCENIIDSNKRRSCSADIHKEIIDRHIKNNTLTLDYCHNEIPAKALDLSFESKEYRHGIYKNTSRPTWHSVETYCYRAMADKLNDASLCDTIAEKYDYSSETSEECYMTFSKRLEDASLCNKIPDHIFNNENLARRDCFISLALDLKNPDICNDLSDVSEYIDIENDGVVDGVVPSEREQCLERFE